MQAFDTAKKGAHEKIIKFMTNNTIHDYTTNWSLDKEHILMMRHAMCVENIFIEERLSSQMRKCLVLKRVNQSLSQQVGNRAIYVARFFLSIVILFESKH